MSQFLLIETPDYITVVICSPGLDISFVLTESFTVEQFQVLFKKPASQKKH